LFRIYGLNLASDFPFAHRLSPSEGIPDLIFTGSSSPTPVGAEDGVRLYSSPWRDEAGESLAHLDRFPGCDRLRFPGTADFYLEPGEIRGHLLDPGQRDLMELRLLGPVLSYWLERLGIAALHASAVRLEHGAAGFVSQSGGGKSSLAAALVRSGAPLLSDDILPIEERGGTFLARPGFPQMRLEPEGARLLGDDRGLRAVSPDDTKLHVPVDAFQASAIPLAALFVLDRRPSGPINIQPLARSEAVIELVRHSFSPYLVEAVGLQPHRLELFARLVRQVPVLRLSYPDGLEHLPRIAETLRFRLM
jgi:hypothetical protein